MKNNKKIVMIVAMIALVAVLGVCLVACNADSVSKKLDKKGYSVATLSENSKGAAAIVYGLVKGDDFKEGLVAAKDDGNSVIVVWLGSDKSAKEKAEKLQSSVALKTFNVKVDRAGKVLYIGTEQGVKDAK